MVSADNEFAKSAVAPNLRSVIGKALNNFEGIIEVVVG